MKSYLLMKQKRAFVLKMEQHSTIYVMDPVQGVIYLALLIGVGPLFSRLVLAETVYDVYSRSLSSPDQGLEGGA